MHYSTFGISVPACNLFAQDFLIDTSSSSRRLPYASSRFAYAYIGYLAVTDPQFRFLLTIATLHTRILRAHLLALKLRRLRLPLPLASLPLHPRFDCQSHAHL